MQVDPPDDGRLAQVGPAKDWARGLPAQPPGAAATAAENAAAAVLAGWPAGAAARPWRPLAEWLQGF
eukprot:7920869-Alexandrium_andersonii.AAC.1